MCVLTAWYTHESVKAEAKRKLIYLLLQLCQLRDGRTGCRGDLLLDIFIGCFYLSILTGEKSLGGDSLEDSVEHHVVDLIVLSASRSPPLNV